MTFPTKTLGACAAIALLSACGGGGGGGPQTVFTYQTLGSPVPGESTLAAVGLTRSGPDAGLADGTEVIIGKIERQTGRLTIGTEIVDAEEVSPNVWRTAGYAVDQTDILGPTNLQFVLPVTVTEIGGTEFASPYIVGVVSRTQDLPTSGLFSFSGSAFIGSLLENPAGGAESAGTLRLDARFGSGSGVNATITGLNANMPFTRVELQNMTISSTEGNATFSGGSISFFDDDRLVATVPNGPTLSTSGAFFGGDPRGPTEVGGVFTVIGENDINNIFGIFAGSRTNAPAP